MSTKPEFRSFLLTFLFTALALALASDGRCATQQYQVPLKDYLKSSYEELYDEWLSLETFDFNGIVFQIVPQNKTSHLVKINPGNTLRIPFTSRQKANKFVLVADTNGYDTELTIELEQAGKIQREKVFCTIHQCWDTKSPDTIIDLNDSNRLKGLHYNEVILEKQYEFDSIRIVNNNPNYYEHILYIAAITLVWDDGSGSEPVDPGTEDPGTEEPNPGNIDIEDPLPFVSNQFDETGDLDDNAVQTYPGTFGNLSPAKVALSSAPSDGEEMGATGNALKFTAGAGQGSFVYFHNGNEKPIDANTKVLVRAAVWCDSANVNVFVGAIDTDQDGQFVSSTLGMQQLDSVPLFVKQWRVVTVLHDSQSRFVKPFVQVVGKDSTANVYVDNIEVYQIDPEQYYSGSFLNGSSSPSSGDEFSNFEELIP